MRAIALSVVVFVALGSLGHAQNSQGRLWTPGVVRSGIVRSWVVRSGRRPRRVRSRRVGQVLFDALRARLGAGRRSERPRRPASDCPRNTCPGTDAPRRRHCDSASGSAGLRRRGGQRPSRHCRPQYESHLPTLTVAGGSTRFRYPSVSLGRAMRRKRETTASSRSRTEGRPPSCRVHRPPLQLLMFVRVNPHEADARRGVGFHRVRQ